MRSTTTVALTTRGREDAETTLLSGPLPDQAALQGVLVQMIRLGLTLLFLDLDTGEAPGIEKSRTIP